MHWPGIHWWDTERRGGRRMGEGWGRKEKRRAEGGRKRENTFTIKDSLKWPCLLPAQKCTVLFMSSLLSPPSLPLFPAPLSPCPCSEKWTCLYIPLPSPSLLFPPLPSLPLLPLAILNFLCSERRWKWTMQGIYIPLSSPVPPITRINIQWCFEWI